MSEKVFVYLKNSILETTEDAICMLIGIEKSEDATRAFRLIHGPGGCKTKCPYIVLCTDESLDEIVPKVEEIVREGYLNEFEDSSDVHVVQILYLGEYYDKRVRWYNV